MRGGRTRAARACAAGLAALAGAAGAGAAPGAASAAEPLQPYQFVRSLQLVQDRIAAGDHAALPMQAKLLELADARFRAAAAGDLQEPRNLDALLIYGMSGGNPATVQAAAARVKLDDANQAVVDGVVAYLSGDPVRATAALNDVEPMALPVDLSAFVALVKGSLLAAEEPAKALALFDRARLVSPGTLVEEAALRRSVRIAAATGDAGRFLLASTQYVARFLHSPYASQFADSFVSGVVALHADVGFDRLVEITAMMDAEREKVIYLRIARRAAIDGLSDLSAFASARAGKIDGGEDDDPRAQLYSSLSSLTSESIATVRDGLERIDRARLSENDRALLDAARTVTREVVAPPPAEDAAQERPAAAPAATPPVPSAAPPAADGTAAAATAAGAGPASDPTEDAIADARRKLETIDRMLGDSPL